MDGNLVITSSRNNGNHHHHYQHLQNLLKSYELTAPDSLGGPASSMATMAAAMLLDPQNTGGSLLSNHQISSIVPKNQSIPPSSMSSSFLGLLQNDRICWTAESKNENENEIQQEETILEGEYIACFNIGGERRLCWPQILTKVLAKCSMVEINKARTELNIHCSYCTKEQLQVLKLCGALSSSSDSCNLITKTDAERLCNYLLLRQRKHHNQQQHQERRGRGGRNVISSSNNTTNTSIDTKVTAAISRTRGGDDDQDDEDVCVPVMHLCFGRCRGRYFPRLYVSPSSECIECDECGDTFGPDRFVMHSHRNQERRVCHWGFDSANWRAYIHLTTDSATASKLLEEKNGRILQRMKLRFDLTGLTKNNNSSSSKKRSQFDDDYDQQHLENGDEHHQQDPQIKKRLKLESPEEDCVKENPFSPASAEVPAPLKQQSPTSLLLLAKELEDPADHPPAAPTASGPAAAWLYLLYDPFFLAAYRQSLGGGDGPIGPILQQQQQTVTSLLPGPPPTPQGSDSTTTTNSTTTTCTSLDAADADKDYRRELISSASKNDQMLLLQQQQLLQLLLRNLSTNSSNSVGQNATSTTTTTDDEATAVAALKLLQSRPPPTTGNKTTDEGGHILENGSQQQPAEPAAATIRSKLDSSTFSPTDASRPSPEQQHLQALSPPAAPLITSSAAQGQRRSAGSSKESYKKHLLHLFSAEQEQQQQQRQHFLDLQQHPYPVPLKRSGGAEEECNSGGRASVEIIVDDDDDDHNNPSGAMHQQLVVTTSLQTSPSNGLDEGMMDAAAEASGRATSTETESADESADSGYERKDPETPPSSSSSASASSLDDLLKTYIHDQVGLEAIRRKMTANRQYLEGKLQALLMENQSLRQECVQLRRHFTNISEEQTKSVVNQQQVQNCYHQKQQQSITTSCW